MRTKRRRSARSFAKGDRAGVAAAVSDGLCDAMAIVGNAEQVRARVRAYAEQGIDVCVINPIADPNGVKKAITVDRRLPRRRARQPERRAARDGKRERG